MEFPLQWNNFFDWCLGYLARIERVSFMSRFRSILFGAIKPNPVTHLKSTNEIYGHKAHVYYFFVNKDGRQLE